MFVNVVKTTSRKISSLDDHIKYSSSLVFAFDLDLVYFKASLSVKLCIVGHTIYEKEIHFTYSQTHTHTVEVYMCNVLEL